MKTTSRNLSASINEQLESKTRHEFPDVMGAVHRYPDLVQAICKCFAIVRRPGTECLWYNASMRQQCTRLVRVVWAEQQGHDWQSCPYTDDFIHRMWVRYRKLTRDQKSQVGEKMRLRINAKETQPTLC